jgi:signal transduction histidine kinase
MTVMTALSLKSDKARSGSDFLHQLLTAAGLTVAISMIALAWSMSERVSASLIQGVADEAALLANVFVGPSIQELAKSPTLSADNSKALDEIVSGQLRTRVKNIKIWLRDGTLAYATVEKDQIGKKAPSAKIDAAFDGSVIGTIRDGDPQGSQPGVPMIHIFSPLRKEGSRDIIAAVEIHNTGLRIADDIRAMRLTTIGIVCAIVVVMTLLLYLLTRRASWLVDQHRDALVQKVAEAEFLARQNAQLRKIADESRIDAAKSNEAFLQQIGHDLHDGPIQLLSLLMLRATEPHVFQGDGGRDPKERTQLDDDSQDIVSRVLTELREICKGLALPQLESLKSAEAVWLPVRAHEYITNTKVGCEIGPLPGDLSLTVKTCIYRIVQEGLNNAFIHAGGLNQRVQVFADDEFVHVIVSDSGLNPLATVRPLERQRTGLGLPGLRRRVDALRGTFEVTSEPGKGTRITARLPLKPGYADASARAE